jgi:hypothetical protein
MLKSPSASYHCHKSLHTKNADSVKNGGDDVHRRAHSKRAFIALARMKVSSRSSGRLAMERIHKFRLRVTAVHVDINFFSVRA